jgi:hypothetical protein
LSRAVQRERPRDPSPFKVGRSCSFTLDHISLLPPRPGMSLFRRKKSASSNNVKDAGLTASSSFATLPLPRSNKASRAPKFATTNESGSSARVASHIDDFGRPLGTAPAFVESDSPQFGRGYGVGEETELQLLYGYAPIETTRELSVQRVVEIVQRCAQEIRLRGESSS